MISTLLTKIGFPVLISIVTEALKSVDTPVTRGAAEALEKVDEAIKQGAITPAQLGEAHRHAEKIAELEIAQYEETVRQVNESLRAEVASEDAYVRRMRPTFGYLMAFTWTAQMLGVAYVIVFETEKAGVVLHAMSALSAIWAVALSVLGIYVYKRSEDKKLISSASPLQETIFWN